MKQKAFTLVELLVVIGIIALLIAILVPSLGKSRRAAQSVACKSLLRQYSMACEMYINDNDGVTVDSYRFLDYEVGLVRYFSANQINENMARCPGDGDTYDRSRVGTLGLGTDAKYFIFTKQGDRYNVPCSIGVNENSTSASARPTSGGTSAFWVKRNKLKILGWDQSKTMVFADWQNNPIDAAPKSPIVKPGGVSAMGTMVFRHNGAMNVAYIDGHVGEVRTKVKTQWDGHDLAPGATWGTAGGGAAYKLYYPFAPGKTPSGYGITGTFPKMDIR